jgi:hypothetical protein
MKAKLASQDATGSEGKNNNGGQTMKVCAIILSLSGLIGGIETVLDSHLAAESNREIVFSRNPSLAMPSHAPPDPSRAVADALADAQGRDISIGELFQPKEEQ